MKIILFSRKGITPRTEDINEIFGAIERYGFDYAINKAFAENIKEHALRTIPTEFIYDGEIGEQSSDSVMVCYGGDGTLLEGAARKRAISRDNFLAERLTYMAGHIAALLIFL